MLNYVVCELAGKLTIRSYYANRRTQERQWDEPPSGASRVVNASDTMRKMANIQLQELQITSGTVPDVEQTTPKSKRAGLGGFFRRSKVDATAPPANLPADSRVQYRSDSFLARAKRDQRDSRMYDEQLDPAMQRALVRSMSRKSRSSARHHDAELEHAMALSLLEAGSADSRRPSTDPQSSSRQVRSASRDRHRSSSRERHSAVLEHRKNGASVREGTGSTDRQRHRSAPTYGSQDRKSYPHHEQSSHLSERNKPKPDPPSLLDLYEPADDGSTVHYEFSHDDEEALAVALSLSLLDVSAPTTKAGAASMPGASVMTEEEQLTIAMEESMAMAPPDLKGHPLALAAEAHTSDWGDRKMPAGRVAAEASRAGTSKSRGKSVFDPFHCSANLAPAIDEHASFARPNPRGTHRQSTSSRPEISGRGALASAESHQGRSLIVSPSPHWEFEDLGETTADIVDRSRSPQLSIQTSVKHWSTESPTGNRSPKSPTDNRSPISPGDGDAHRHFHFS